MNNRQPQLALRELRHHMSKPITLGACAGVAMILAIAGPFNTDQVMLFAPRAFYWLIVVTLSYGSGFFIEGLLRTGLSHWTLWPRVVFGGALTGICVLVIVVGINSLAFGFIPQGSEWFAIVAPILGISIIISVLAALFSKHLSDIPSSGANEQTAKAVAILDRIPLEKRATLVALSVEDHYVRVQTKAGEALVLMRLSDSMRETGDIAGAQVHRSHWIAFDQIQAVKRVGDRAIATMTTGKEIPVSRSNIAKLKDAGLLL